jgi:hypothetical protein
MENKPRDFFLLADLYILLNGAKEQNYKPMWFYGVVVGVDGLTHYCGLPILPSDEAYLLCMDSDGRLKSIYPKD